jgi:hypothetical protein
MSKPARISSPRALIEDCLRAVLWFAAFAIAGIAVLLGAIMALNVRPLTALFD